MKNLTLKLVIAAFVASLSLSAANTENSPNLTTSSGYKNIIFMVPDGCSPTIQTLARWYKGEDLTVDSMNAGMVKCHMANSVIPGSAAAATAFACGDKTTARFLGVCPRQNDLLSTHPGANPAMAYAPMASILEFAKDKKKSTGLVATSRITHATPAAFASHIADRGWDNEIMEHMVYNNLTVSLGGGRRHLLPTADGGKREDGENLEQVLRNRGYHIATTRDEMMAAPAYNGAKLWGSFAMSHMDSEIDRPHLNPTEPSLSEMTKKAIDVLSTNPNGFFLMVEASQVDWAGHNNDPVYMVTDFIEFDNAVAEAVKFAQRDGNTLVMAFPDHNTGGLEIGQYYQSSEYTETTVEDLINPLKHMQLSANSVVDQMKGDYSVANMQAVLKTYWGLDASEADINEILDLSESVGMSNAMARIITKNHTMLGWTTHGHNGEDVPIWVFPQSQALGVIDNTEIPEVVEFWRTESGPNTLPELSSKLYNNVEDVFPGEWSIDTSDAENPVLVVRDDARMPISKDMLIIGDTTHLLGSLVVWAPLRDGDKADGDIHTVLTDRVYIPQAAIDLINNM